MKICPSPPARSIQPIWHFFVLNDRYTCIDMLWSIQNSSKFSVLQLYSNAISPCTFLIGKKMKNHFRVHPSVLSSQCVRLFFNKRNLRTIMSSNIENYLPSSRYTQRNFLLYISYGDLLLKMFSSVGSPNLRF